MNKYVSQLTLLTHFDLNLLGVGSDNKSMSEGSIISIAQMCGTLKNLTTLKLNLSWGDCGSDRAFEEMNK
jgi:hypothetical protein